MSNFPSELQGLKKTESLIIQKLNYLRSELVVLSGGSRKFELMKEIQNLEKDLDALRSKINQGHTTVSPHTSKIKSNSYVFLNYAEVDLKSADKIDTFLTKNDVNVWYDKKSIKVGQKREIAINKGIKNARYVLILLSSASVQKRGYVNVVIRRSLKLAMRNLEDDSFIIPIRLDDCEASFEELNDLQPLDLFPDFEKGLSLLLETINDEQT